MVTLMWFSGTAGLAQSRQAYAPPAWAAAAAEQSTPADGLLEPAQRLLREGKLKEAETAARGILASQPHSAGARYLLAYILFRQIGWGSSAPPASYLDFPDPGVRAQASLARASLAEYTEAAKYRDPSAFDLKIVALNYVLLGDLADADKWLSKSLQWDSHDAQAWYYLGRTRYGENRFEESVEAFQRCLALDPDNVKALDNLGLSYTGLGRSREAIAAYQRAIQLQRPSIDRMPGPLLNLGSLLLDQNRVAEAIPYLEEAAAIAPQEARMHEKLGKAYSLSGRLNEAQAELEKAVQLAPSSAPLHFMLGQVYRKQGLLEKAKAELERSAALNRKPAQ